MGVLSESQDAFGAAIEQRSHGGSSPALIERDDGMLDLDTMDYLAPHRRWPSHERDTIRRVRGRVLDVGCGCGRVAVHLEPKGIDVVSIDVSPGALRVSRGRGARDVRGLAASEVRASDGPFDAVVMFGNNAGLLRDARHAPWLLKRFAGLTSPKGVLVASTLDPYRTDEPVHLAYHRRNRIRGRMGGQVRLRVRFKTLSSPWFDYLFTSVEELERLIAGTGWKLDEVIEGDGPAYAFALRKAISSRP